MLGSSSNSTRGFDIRPRAIASICCSPPESVPATWRMRSRSTGNMVSTCSSLCRTSCLPVRRKAPILRFSPTVRRPKMRRPSGTCTMPRPTTSWGGTSVSASPSKRTSPSAGARMLLMVFRVVVLPAPLAPIRVTISSLPTSRESPLRAWMLP